MTKGNINRYLKSRWDARFLINTIMGLLTTQRGPYADVVLAVVTAAIRSYSRACLGKMNKSQEEGIYEALKDYAKERAILKGKDSKMMECFIALMDWVESESEVWAFDFGNENIEKASASFPMDCLNEEQIDIVTNQSWERFRAFSCLWIIRSVCSSIICSIQDRSKSFGTTTSTREEPQILIMHLLARALTRTE